MGIPYYWKSIDWDALMVEYPPPPRYAESVGRMDPVELRALQEKRLQARLQDAWRTPFYRERWAAAGIKDGDVQGLDDLVKLPTVNGDDFSKAIVRQPPFGNHHPIEREDFGKIPVKIQTSGGQPPRPILFDPLTREVSAIQGARAFYAQGARPGQVMQIPINNALMNAAWWSFTSALYWLGCSPVTTGSDAVTPAEKQIEYARDWGTNSWIGLPGYLLKLAEVATEMGIDVKKFPTAFIHSYLGVDEDGALRRQLQDAWGAPVYDNYGSNEVGLVAFECSQQDRLHVQEDVAILETVDEHDKPVGFGEKGSLVVTSLSRSTPPIIRFKIGDTMRLSDRAECPCGIRSVKISGLLGK